jgi:hypothetical protein
MRGSTRANHEPVTANTTREAGVRTSVSAPLGLRRETLRGPFALTPALSRGRGGCVWRESIRGRGGMRGCGRWGVLGKEASAGRALAWIGSFSTPWGEKVPAGGMRGQPCEPRAVHAQHNQHRGGADLCVRSAGSSSADNRADGRTKDLDRPGVPALRTQHGNGWQVVPFGSGRSRGNSTGRWALGATGWKPIVQTQNDRLTPAFPETLQPVFAGGRYLRVSLSGCLPDVAGVTINGRAGGFGKRFHAVF